MQFSLNMMAMALALVTAAAAIPITTTGVPSFVPGPQLPAKTFTGPNPFSALTFTKTSDN